MPIKERSPGPMMVPFSSVNRQVYSKYKNPYVASFDMAERCMLSDETNSPGPGNYNVKKPVGIFVESDRPNSPSYTISGRELFGTFLNDINAAHRPGPGEYRQDPINKPSSPQYTMQHKPHPMRDASRRPGPGQYKIPSTLDTHAAIFDQQTRPTIFDAHANVIGPGEYKTGESIGIQTESVKPTEPIYSIPRAPRSTFRGMQDPYYKTKIQSALGKQVLSKYKTGPKYSLSGRFAFGSIYQ